MNETITSNDAAAAPGSSSDHRVRVPNTSMLPGTEQPLSAAVALLNHAVQGAHDTIDRLAGSAAPVARQLGEGVSAAEDALHVKTDQLRLARDEWIESMRTTVRSKPLVSVAAALALGAVIGRITR